MLKKLAGYSLLSCASFCLSLTVFHAVANAEMNEVETAIVKGHADPVPTVFLTQEQTPGPYFDQSYPTNTPSPTQLPTPTPSPAPTAKPIATSTDLESLFSRYSEQYHADKELLKKIAKCESGFRSEAQNGDYKGMYQFATQTWISTRGRMGLDTNPDLRSNAEEAIRTAAYMVGQGRQNAWANCL